MKEAIRRLKELLEWSDRLGAEEVYHIREAIALLEGELAYEEV